MMTLRKTNIMLAIQDQHSCIRIPFSALNKTNCVISAAKEMWRIILERNKDRQCTAESETNVSVREEMSLKAQMGKKVFLTTQSHFQQGRSDFRLPVCYSALTADDEGVLVQVSSLVQSSLSFQTELTKDSSAYQTAWQLHQHPSRPRRQPKGLCSPTHTHAPDSPSTGLDP